MTQPNLTYVTHQLNLCDHQDNSFCLSAGSPKTERGEFQPRKINLVIKDRMKRVGWDVRYFDLEKAKEPLFTNVSNEITCSDGSWTGSYSHFHKVQRDHFKARLEYVKLSIMANLMLPLLVVARTEGSVKLET